MLDYFVAVWRHNITLNNIKVENEIAPEVDDEEYFNRDRFIYTTYEQKYDEFLSWKIIKEKGVHIDK